MKIGGNRSEGARHSDPHFLSSPKIKDVILESIRGAAVSMMRITLDSLKFVVLKQ